VAGSPLEKGRTREVARVEGRFGGDFGGGRHAWGQQVLEEYGGDADCDDSGDFGSGGEGECCGGSWGESSFLYMGLGEGW